MEIKTINKAPFILPAVSNYHIEANDYVWFQVNIVKSKPGTSEHC